MALPELCSRCRKLKQPDLGKFVGTSQYRRRVFVCFACLDKQAPAKRGRDRQPSPDEKAAAVTLAASGLKFVQEHSLGPFWFDFAIPSLMLLVEIDSHTYHRFPRQLRRDRDKQRYAEAGGWKVVRVRRPDAAGKVTAAADLRAAELGL